MWRARVLDIYRKWREIDGVREGNREKTRENRGIEREK